MPAASSPCPQNDIPEIHQFLDGFYMSRVGIRMLIGQHITLHEPPKPNHIGLINTKTSPIAVAQEAIAGAREICLREYGCAPEAEIYGAPNLTFPYVPGHLHHMLFELIKNSLRAVQDRFEDSNEEVRGPGGARVGYGAWRAKREGRLRGAGRGG